MAQEINKSEQPTAPAPTYVDPFTSMRAEMDRVFDNFLGRRWMDSPSLFRASGQQPMMPSIDVHESETEFAIEAELPGMEEKDVEVTLREGVLTLQGEKKSEQEETKNNYHMTERSYGRFQRSFRVPDSVDQDKVEAKLENGVLRVKLAKRPDAVKSERKIPIGGT